VHKGCPLLLPAGAACCCCLLLLLRPLLWFSHHVVSALSSTFQLVGTGPSEPLIVLLLTAADCC
jgi:hypothetical protein